MCMALQLEVWVKDSERLGKTEQKKLRDISKMENTDQKKHNKGQHQNSADIKTELEKADKRITELTAHYKTYGAR